MTPMRMVSGYSELKSYGKRWALTFQKEKNLKLQVICIEILITL